MRKKALHHAVRTSLENFGEFEYESGDLFAQQPILHIMQIDPLKVIANISEQYFPNVKVGMPVELKEIGRAHV